MCDGAIKRIRVATVPGPHRIKVCIPKTCNKEGWKMIEAGLKAKARALIKIYPPFGALSHFCRLRYAHCSNLSKTGEVKKAIDAYHQEFARAYYRGPF